MLESTLLYLINQFLYSMFTLHAVALNDVKSVCGSDILRKFLTETSCVYSLKEKMTLFYQRASRIQTAYRTHKQAFQNRMNHLGKILWEKEK
jgi:hypothetical protein